MRIHPRVGCNGHNIRVTHINITLQGRERRVPILLMLLTPLHNDFITITHSNHLPNQQQYLILPQMSLNHRQMFEQQQRTILQQSMNYGGEHNLANTIQKIEIKDIQQKSNHIGYRILTMFSGGNRKTKHVNATRRFSDFEKLHLYFRYIVGKSVPLMVPKLPNKHAIQDYMEFEEDSKAEFLNERKEDLEIYLNLLVENECIRDDPVLKQFLEEGPTDKLDEEINKANFKIPSSAPEKAYYIIKKTINSVKSIFDNFNAPAIEVDPGLKSKIEKIERIKSSMSQLISLEMERAKCLKMKQRELGALKTTESNGLLQGLASTLKQKLLSLPTDHSQSTNGLPCIQKLYNYIQKRFKEQKNHCDKMQQMKKCIKTMIARCDTVLDLFSQIISDKEEEERMIRRMLELEKSVRVEKYVKEGLGVLQEYSNYYKVINKLGGSDRMRRLSQVNEEEDEQF